VGIHVVDKAAAEPLLDPQGEEGRLLHCVDDVIAVVGHEVPRFEEQQQVEWYLGQRGPDLHVPDQGESPHAVNADSGYGDILPEGIAYQINLVTCLTEGGQQITDIDGRPAYAEERLRRQE